VLQFLTCLPKATNPPPLKRPWENDKGGQWKADGKGGEGKGRKGKHREGKSTGSAMQLPPGAKAGLHTDSHNDASSLNAVLAISETLRGDILSPQDGPAIFSARSIDKLPASDLQTLTSLGFPLLSPSSQDQADLQARAPLVPTVQLDLTHHGCQAGAQITIENPTNSWYWSILALQIRRCKDKQLKAVSLAHPMDVAAALPKITLDAILKSFSSDQKSLALKRKIALMKAEILAKKLEKDEGVPLVGASDCPPCFETKVRPAVLTEAELRAAAPDLRRGMMSRSLHQEPEHTAHLLEATREELASGFIQGPFTEEQVTAHFGHRHWLAIRRFIIKQGQKLRPIEDCCEAHLNEAYAATIKLRLQDADFFVAMALEVARLSGNNPKAARPWVAKCLDLAKAYKQLPVAGCHRDLAVIMVEEEDGSHSFYLSSSLMFGSTSAVFAFNRVSRSIWWLLTKVLHIPCSHFYDDFPMLVPEDMGSEADASASRSLSLLGWRHAKTGEGGKGHPFMSRFDVLGLSADVAKLHLGTLVLSNKEGRAEKIQDLLCVVSDEGRITRHQGQVLLGLLRFASGFYGGRTL
ncbi:unnamed protein product, partial [Symbiodinium necroappetens]